MPKGADVKVEVLVSLAGKYNLKIGEVAMIDAETAKSLIKAKYVKKVK